MEQNQFPSPTEQLEPGDGLGNPFDDGSPFAATVNVRHGVLRETARAGSSVGEIRRLMHDRMGVTDDSTAFVDGREVGPDHRVAAGQTLTFMRQAGEKGSDFTTVFAGGDVLGDMTVTLQHGVFCLNVSGAWRTVGDLRRRFERELSIPRTARAFIDGQEADESAVVSPGQTVHFLRGAGRMGDP